MSAPPYWPTRGWQASTPEKQGLKSRNIVQVLRAIRARIPRMHSLLIVRNGYLVAEAYFHPFGPDWRHGVASCTKPVLPLPAFARSVSNRTIAFEANPLGWKTLVLTFAAGSDAAHVSCNGSTSAAVGLDGVPRLTAEPDRTQRSAWQG